MNISDAQWDVRTVFLGGFGGQLVSGLIWLVSAALATWRSPKSAIIALVVGGFFIFPLTQLLLRLMGRPASLPKGHPMNALGMQIATEWSHLQSSICNPDTRANSFVLLVTKVAPNHCFAYSISSLSSCKGCKAVPMASSIVCSRIDL